MTENKTAVVHTGTTAAYLTDPNQVALPALQPSGHTVPGIGRQ
jgi:hypothetical protein